MSWPVRTRAAASMSASVSMRGIASAPAGTDAVRLARLRLSSRGTVLPLFRARMTASHLAIMERRCAEFVARLGDNGTFDLPHEMNELVLGVIMEAFLGADFARHMPPAVARDFRDFIRGVDPITPAWVPAPHLLRARRARDRLHNGVGDLVRARRSQPVDPPTSCRYWHRPARLTAR